MFYNFRNFLILFSFHTKECKDKKKSQKLKAIQLLKKTFNLKNKKLKKNLLEKFFIYLLIVPVNLFSLLNSFLDYFFDFHLFKLF